jgi:hypothetical protein
MANLIFTAYAIDTENDAKSVSGVGKTDIYLQNAYCCLVSAKKYNPDDHVALVTNAQLPSHYSKVYKEAGIEVVFKPFDAFLIPEKDAKWRLAFYKLCALFFVAEELNYEKILLLDTDVITIGSYRELWLETDAFILLHQVVHSYDNPNEKIMQQELKRIFNLENCIHWGGEFVCGSRERLQVFLNYAKELFETMVEKGIYSTRGDEFILTAALRKFAVKSASAYVDRCWTGKGYYFTSTHMYYGLAALHLPDEKWRGIQRLYNKLLKNQYPAPKQLFKLMRIPSGRCPLTRYTMLDQIDRVKKKIKKVANIFRKDGGT